MVLYPGARTWCTLKSWIQLHWVVLSTAPRIMILHQDSWLANLTMLFSLVNRGFLKPSLTENKQISCAMYVHYARGSFNIPQLHWITNKCCYIVYLCLRKLRGGEVKVQNIGNSTIRNSGMKPMLNIAIYKACTIEFKLNNFLDLSTKLCCAFFELTEKAHRTEGHT